MCVKKLLGAYFLQIFHFKDSRTVLEAEYTLYVLQGMVYKGWYANLAEN